MLPIAHRTLYPFALVLILTTGCMDPPAPPAPKSNAPPAISEFDPAADKQVIKPKAKITDPITGPLAVKKNVDLKFPNLQIEQAVNLFQASEGRYPASLDEFMTRIIRENNIRLPQLAPGQEYQYDVDNHKLVIVQSAGEKVAP
jgi:hypothetical protein